MLDPKELYEHLVKTREGRRFCCTDCGVSYGFDNIHMCKNCGAVYCIGCYWGPRGGASKKCPCGGDLI